MKSWILLLFTLNIFFVMAQNNHPLLCDPQTGVCGTSQSEKNTENSLHSNSKKIQIIYYTDPICSSCWGFEPQLRKLKLEYGDLFTIDYHMGGLLPDWSYNSGGISKPSDVAHHWDEVSPHYDMPIDGDIWLENPLDSSYPPSIAFKAAQLQDTDKAVVFLRELREMVFLQKKNITQWEHIAEAAKNAQLDIAQLKSDYEHQAPKAFQQDLDWARKIGVRGFPTVIFLNGNQQEVVYGARPYAFFEMAILKLNPDAVKQEYHKDWKSLFGYYPSLTAREFTELSGTPRKDSEQLLNTLTQQGILTKFETKNGAIWKIK